MTNYANGRRAEYAARDELQRRGYFVVRSAGSRGVVDLVALPVHGGRPLLVQVKRGVLRGQDVAALASAELPDGCDVELWHFAGHGATARWRCVGRDMLPMTTRPN